MRTDAEIMREARAAGAEWARQGLPESALRPLAVVEKRRMLDADVEGMAANLRIDAESMDDILDRGDVVDAWEAGLDGGRAAVAPDARWIDATLGPPRDPVVREAPVEEAYTMTLEAGGRLDVDVVRLGGDIDPAESWEAIVEEGDLFECSHHATAAEAVEAVARALWLRAGLLAEHRLGDAVIEGARIASVSSREPESRRWTEITLYRTPSGRVVAHVAGCSSVDGETTRHRVITAEDLDDLRRQARDVRVLADELIEEAAAVGLDA